MSQDDAPGSVAGTERPSGNDGIPGGDADESGRSRDELVVELERLRERNQQLRATYERARTTQYRRTAAGLAALGLVGVASAALVPSLRDVLLVLGSIGLFGGLLTFYLTPERFVAADIGRGVYETMADDRAELVGELGLTDERVYVSVGEGARRARLFVPQYDSYEIPSEDALDDALVVPEKEAARGATFTPTGSPLYESLLEALPGNGADRPVPLVEQVGNALVEQFELVDHARVDTSAEGGRLTVGVGETVYGSAERFDSPVVSLYAVALARTLDKPVTVEVDVVEEGRDAYLITLRWSDHDSGS